MRRRTYLIALIGLLCPLGIQPVPADEPPIRVGATVSLSGQYTAFGQRQLNGMQMWADDVNARGALLGRGIELVYYDDKSDSETSAELYERLISEDNVDLLLGPYSSELTLAASSVAERHNFPMLATAASATKIFSRGYQNIFGMDVPANEYMTMFLEIAAEHGIKRIALIYADTEFAREVAEGVRAWKTSHGLDIVLDEAYDRDNPEFSGLVERIIRSNPEVVVGGTYLRDSIDFVRQAKASQLSPEFFVFTVGPGVIDFGKELGPDAEAIAGVVQWIRSGRLPQARDFAFRYEGKFGYLPGVHAAIGYSAGQVLEAAVRLARSVERDKVREQLRSLIFRSLIGHFRVDETGKQIAKVNYVMQWQDGERRLILPDNVRERDAIFPFPSWSER